jgi:hypothetical protein
MKGTAPTASTAGGLALDEYALSALTSRMVKSCTVRFKSGMN